MIPPINDDHTGRPMDALPGYRRVINAVPDDAENVHRAALERIELIRRRKPALVLGRGTLLASGRLMRFAGGDVALNPTGVIHIDIIQLPILHSTDRATSFEDRSRANRRPREIKSRASISSTRNVPWTASTRSLWGRRSAILAAIVAMMSRLSGSAWVVCFMLRVRHRSMNCPPPCKASLDPDIC